jgi:hypothetical protein
MYLDGRQLGDELTDNSYDNDGYRFHDVLHLAIVANLGWSPVLRSLLAKKRKSKPDVDEVEDGARAKIVEEAVIKIIHSEGQKISEQRGSATHDKLLFQNHSEISFRFLESISNLTKGLEASKNQYWEWENAILQGSRVFHDLCEEGQGTVRVDLNKREISFVPDVYIDGPGTVVASGTSLVEVAKCPRPGGRFGENDSSSGFEPTEEFATKHAILDSLRVEANEENLDSISVRIFGDGVSVKASGNVQAAMWKRKVASFRTSVSKTESIVTCTAIAIALPPDNDRPSG